MIRGAERRSINSTSPDKMRDKNEVNNERRPSRREVGRLYVKQFD